MYLPRWAMPPVSQQKIEALYDTVALEQLQANQKAAGESDSAQNPIDRWDLQGDATAKEIFGHDFSCDHLEQCSGGGVRLY